MKDDDGSGPVLIIETRAWGRGDTASWVAFGVFFGGVGFCVLAFVVSGWHLMTRGEAVAGCLFATFLVWFGPVLAMIEFRGSPRGTWRIDGEGVAFRSPRGETRRLRWKDVERVCWSHNGVALRGGGTCLRLPLALVDEPMRGAAAARLDAILGCDFDLAFRRVPDPLDAVEPAWRNVALRLARGLAVVLVLFATLAVPLYLAATWHPEQGAWQGRAVVLAWGVLIAALLVRTRRAEARLNPTWRRRRAKSAADDLFGPN